MGSRESGVESRENAGYMMLGTECRIQDTEYRIQDTEYRIQYTEYRMKGLEYG